MDKKRLIISIAFLIITIAIGYLLYRVFFAPPATITYPPAGIAPAEHGQFPTAEEGRVREAVVTRPGELPTAAEAEREALAGEKPKPLITQLVDKAIVNPTVDKAGNVKYYNGQDGKFYRLDRNGLTELMNDQTFYQVRKVTWSPVADEAVLEYPDGANIYFNFQTKEQVTLPKHWEEFDYAPLGNQIAAKSLALDVDNNWLITANPSGSGISLIEPVGKNADKVTIDWSPNNQIIATSLTGEPLGADQQEVLFVGLHGENFKSITVEGRGLKSQWSPDGKRLLYSVYNARNDYKPELWIVNAEGGDTSTGRKLLNVSTWADKCAFADVRFVYCAVPNSLKTGAGFAPQTADNTPDTIYRIDTQTGLRTPLSGQEGNYVIDSMFVSSDGNTLYFTDKRQSGLFQLAI